MNDIQLVKLNITNGEDVLENEDIVTEERDMYEVGQLFKNTLA